MAIMTFQKMRDLVFYDLGDFADGITDTKIAIVFADITREIVTQLEAQENYKTAEIDISADDTSGPIPEDATFIKRVSYESTENVETFVNVLQHDDLASRKWYAEKRLYYIYCVGRTLHTSWTPAADLTLTVYYYPFLQDMELRIDSTKFGSNSSYVPIQLTRAFRYGVLGDLMLTHGKTEYHLLKSSLYDKKYKTLVDWAVQNVKQVMPSYEYKAIKDY